MTDTSLKIYVVYSMLMPYYNIQYVNVMYFNIYLYLINNKGIQNMILGSKSKIDNVILQKVEVSVV